MVKICKIKNCTLKHHAKGLCKAHYNKELNKKDPDYNKKQVKAQIRWRKNNPKRNKEVSLQYRTSIKGRFGYAKRSSKRRKKNWNISFNFYKNIIDNACVYCNEYEENGTGIGLDRIDNNKGYEENNVVRCCGQCNGFRSNKITHEELVIAYRAIHKYRRSK